jgi:peptidoglycan/xylan/chitin deacetylase (PgdA/CDA1 family)
MDWAQVRELRASGMAIGSHGLSHRNLARLKAAELEREFLTSREVIGERIGGPTDLFSYPFGKPKVHVTSPAREMARITSYRLAVAVNFRGVPDPVPASHVPRFFADGDPISKLESKIRGDYEPIGWWQRHVPLSLMRMVSPQDFKG